MQEHLYAPSFAVLVLTLHINANLLLCRVHTKPGSTPPHSESFTCIINEVCEAVSHLEQYSALWRRDIYIFLLLMLHFFPYKITIFPHKVIL